MFGTALDTGPVRVRRRRWFALQPRMVAMAPDGHIYFHPASPLYCDDLSQAGPGLRALFIHELVHVWQVQRRGSWHLITRWPFSNRYSYALKPGWRLERYGLEQQAMIVQHAFQIASGFAVAGAPSLAIYRSIMPEGFALGKEPHHAA